MECPNCKGEVRPGWKLCPVCGTLLPAAPGSVPPPLPGRGGGTSGSVVAVRGDGTISRTNFTGGVPVPPAPAPPLPTQPIPPVPPPPPHRQEPATAPSSEPQPQPERSPVLQVGADSVVKATIDASSQYSGDHVQGNKVVQHITQNESAVATILRLASGNGKLEELERQLAAINWGADPADLRHVFRQQMLVLEEESFGDTVRAVTRGWGWYGLIGPSTASKERKLRMRACRTIIAALEDLAPRNPAATPVLEDCRRRYDAVVKQSTQRLWIVWGVLGAVTFLLLSCSCLVPLMQQTQDF